MRIALFNPGEYDGFIYLSKINDMKNWNAAFRHSNDVERELCTKVYESRVSHITDGENSEYDIQLHDGTKVEVKVTSYTHYDKWKNDEYFIETAKMTGIGQNGLPEFKSSGLHTTHADEYLILHLGFLNNFGMVGKVKVVSVETLKYIEKTSKRFIYPNGTFGFLVDKTSLGKNDGWVGCFKYNPEDNTYDTRTWISNKKPNKIKKREEIQPHENLQEV